MLKEDHRGVRGRFLEPVSQLRRKPEWAEKHSAINYFFNFRPEIACQAPKPPNSHKRNKIELAF